MCSNSSVKDLYQKKKKKAFCLVSVVGYFRRTCLPYKFYPFLGRLRHRPVQKFRWWINKWGIQALSCCCSVAKTCLTLWLQGPKHSRLPCPSVSPIDCSFSCPLSWWCHLFCPLFTPFSSCLQSFPASGSFPMSWLFTSGGYSIGASASASFLPMNIQGPF